MTCDVEPLLKCLTWIHTGQHALIDYAISADEDGITAHETSLARQLYQVAGNKVLLIHLTAYWKEEVGGKSR